MPRALAWTVAWLAASGVVGHAARGDTTVEVVSAAIDSGKLISTMADCPEGAVVLGGGTDVSDPLGIELTSSAPLFDGVTLLSTPDGPAGAPTGWSGGARNDSGSPGSLHVGAICAPGVDVSAVVASVSVPGGSFAGATAECPEDAVAIGGGVALANLALVVTESGPQFAGGQVLPAAPEGENPAPVAWTAYAQNPGGGSPLMKVAVLCAALPDVVTFVAKRNTMPMGGSASGNANCPDGAVAVGGGIASANPLELTVTATAPWFAEDESLAQRPDGTNPAPVGWYSGARNDSEDFLVVSWAAICVPEPGAALGSLAALAALGGLARRRRAGVGSASS